MSLSSVSERKSPAELATKLNKAFYQVDQQVKLMDLEAEVDSLLQQLENLKQQKLSACHLHD